MHTIDKYASFDSSFSHDKRAKNFSSTFSNWFTVYINSEIINAKEPRSKFIDEEEAWENAYAYAEILKIDVEEK